MSKPDEAERQRLAAALRQLRTGAGLTTTQLAERLGWSQAKVSRTELGQTRPKPPDVEAWAGATGADPALRRELVGIAERTTNQFTEWRRALAPGRRRVQQDIQRLETAASVIRVFAPHIVVGLAQTRPYVAAMFRMGSPPIPADEFEEIVQARIERQAVVDDESKQFYLLIGETALRRQLVSVQEMHKQVQWLIELSTRPNVTLSAIPFHADELVHYYHGFAIYGDPERDEESIVRATTVTRAINIRSPEEIAQYVEHFEALRSAALEGDELRAFLLGVIADLTS